MKTPGIFPKLFWLAFCGLSAGFLFVANAAAGNPASLLVNGDFETAPFDTHTITGWTIGGVGKIEAKAEGSTTPTHSAAFSAGGDVQGDTLSQSFATVAGQVYTLDFDAGIFGTKSGTSQLRVQVTGNSPLVDQTITPPYAGTYNPASVIFQHYHYMFTANSGTTVLQFTDIGLGNANADIVLDTVSVAVPTPSLLINGDFETAPFDTHSIAGWTIGGTGKMEAKNEGSTSPTHSAAFSAGGDVQGDTLSQSFATVAGQVYTLDFDAGIFGVKSGTLQLRTQVFGNNTLLDQTVTPPYSGTWTPGLIVFQHYHYTFTANSSTAILQFTDVGLGNAYADLVVDTVSVTGLAPTPAPTPTATPTPTPSGGALLVNGDFDTAPFATRGVINGWTVGGSGRIAANTEGATTGTHSAAFSEGGDFQGDTLTQSFATVPGQVYSIEFDAGIFGTKTGTLQLRFQLTGNTSLLDQTVTPPYSATTTSNAVKFQHYHYTFTANSSTTVLKFTDVGLGNASADIVLDTVSVVPAPSLITNGTFETAPFDSAGNITGWTVGGPGKIEAKMEGSTSTSHSAAFGAGGDSQDNTLSQTLNTNVLEFYTLEFDAAIFGTETGTLQLRVQQLGSGPFAFLDQTITPPYVGTFNPSAVPFQHYRYTFLAIDTTTTLQFSDIGLGNASADVVLDTVSVTPATSLLGNGDFESGSTGWLQDGAANIVAGAYPHAGSYYAALGNANNTTGQLTTADFVRIPRDASAITLSYWLDITSQKTTNTGLDRLTVAVFFNFPDAGSATVPLATYSEADRGVNQAGTQYYVRHFVDLTPYKGMPIKVLFLFDSTGDQSLPTNFRIDDVTVDAVYPSP